MGDDNDFNLGALVTDLGGKYLDYRLRLADQAVRWVPGHGNGPTYGLGADGRLYTRGAEAGALPIAGGGINSLLLIGLVIVAGFAAFRLSR